MERTFLCTVPASRLLDKYFTFLGHSHSPVSSPGPSPRVYSLLLVAAFTLIVLAGPRGRVTRKVPWSYRVINS